MQVQVYTYTASRRYEEIGFLIECRKPDIIIINQILYIEIRHDRGKNRERNTPKRYRSRIYESRCIIRERLLNKHILIYFSFFSPGRTILYLS